jgi:predicted NUDIX family NTP pyrophosphohydrolase
VAKSKAKSAGLLLYRVRAGELEVFIAHMGGPFWVNKDDRGWSIVKGEYQEDEDPWLAACREFSEETGSRPPEGPKVELGEVRQPSGKRIITWAIEGDFDPDSIKSNTFTMEWPRGSGNEQEFPEIDRAQWFDTVTARRKLVKGQVPFIEILEREILGEVQDPAAVPPEANQAEKQHSLF